jgi:calcium-dependent protein kinase
LGLNYMHKKNIVHRDIKPENILMESRDTDNLNIRITDFGFAKFYDPKTGGLKESLGSPLYMAPEIVKNLPYDAKVDIWSLGVVAYILLSGKPPFSGTTKQEIFMQLSSQSISYTDNSAWLKVSREAKSLVKKMLTRDPRIRPSAEDLLAHEFFQDKVLAN